jgi:hypothetical protein
MVGLAPESAPGQHRSSNHVCVTSAITQTAARKRTFADFAFVPKSEVVDATDEPITNRWFYRFDAQTECFATK